MCIHPPVYIYFFNFFLLQFIEISYSFFMYTPTLIIILHMSYFVSYFGLHMWFFSYVYIRINLFLSFIWVICLYESYTYLWRLIGVAIACIFKEKNYQYIFPSWTVRTNDAFEKRNCKLMRTSKFSLEKYSWCET